MRTRPFVLAFLVCLALVGAAFAVSLAPPVRSHQPRSSPAPPADPANSTVPRTHLPQTSLPSPRIRGAVLVPQQVAPSVVVAIEAASFVEVEIYELGNPAVIAALIAAHNRGVPVRVILDPTEHQSIASAGALRAAGVPVATLAVPGGIDHVKLVVTNQGVIAGGVNLGASSGDTTDMDLSLPASDVASASRIFNGDWAAATGSGHPPSGGFGPFVTGPAIQTAILAHATGGCVVLANYLTDYAVRDAIRSAIRRGVVIDVVLNPTAYGYTAAVAALVSAGAAVAVAPPSPYLHAKVAACGAEAIVGSANFSYDGMAVNHEVDVVVSGPLAQAVTARAERIFQAS